MIGGAIVLATLLASVAQPQMMQGGMMGGGRHGMINLVSPADSPTQIRLGTVAIGSYATGMMGSGMTGLNGSATPGIRLLLRLSGVTDTNGLVTSASNHFILEGQLTTSTDNRTPISIDQPFALKAGAAWVQVPLSLPSVTGPATIVIDRVAVEDGNGNEFAVPGVSLARPVSRGTAGPTPQVTPQPTVRGSCTSDLDCDDGDPDTQDVCTPMGCRHIGPGGSPMM